MEITLNGEGVPATLQDAIKSGLTKTAQYYGTGGGNCLCVLQTAKRGIEPFCHLGKKNVPWISNIDCVFEGTLQQLTREDLANVTTESELFDLFMSYTTHHDTMGVGLVMVRMNDNLHWSREKIIRAIDKLVDLGILKPLTTRPQAEIINHLMQNEYKFV